MKVCVICHALLPVSEGLCQVYCSDQCRSKAFSAKEWVFRRNGGGGKCLRCGEDTVKTKRYCSSRCAGAYWRANNRPRRDPVSAICAHCGDGFVSAPKRGPIARFCSVKCKSAAWNRANPPEPPCPTTVCVQCHSVYPRPVDSRGQFGNSKFCSSECKLKARHERLMVASLSCARCGDPLPVPGHRRKFCGDECAKSSRSGNTHRRRAKRYGVDYEKVDPLAVYERDGWMCGLCGEPVDRRLQWPHPLSASQDHIVPISQGGPHTFDNVQCAHLECNLVARIKVG